MGAETSKLKNLNQSINQHHSNIDKIYSAIITDGAQIITYITNNGYLNDDKFCEKLGYLKVQELKDFFPIKTLQGVQYRIGVMPQLSQMSTESRTVLDKNKDAICRDIINFHKKNSH